MKIKVDFPPNFSEICAALPAVRNKRGVIFTYGSTLYNPYNVVISDDLMAHEETHTKQQGKSPKKWWEKYLSDPQFRYEQELECYRVQHHEARKVSRQYARAVLRHISKDLSSSLYGDIGDRKQAEQLIKEVSA